MKLFAAIVLLASAFTIPASAGSVDIPQCKRSVFSRSHICIDPLVIKAERNCEARECPVKPPKDREPKDRDQKGKKA